MGLKSILAKPFASIVARKVRAETKHALQHQDAILTALIKKAGNTAFGRDHHFASIRTYADFKKQVPVRDYEGLSGYIERIKAGERDILWPGRPAYLAKTSGTTSGAKYIPITRDSIPNHILSARNALLMYIHETGKSGFADGRMIFLQGSPKLDRMGGIKTGRLSGIVYHFVPAYLLRNRLPSYATNCIEDWETKVEAICRETMHENMTLISGIPPWVLMYFEKLLELCGRKNIKEIFPQYSLFVYGGVNFEPYRARIHALTGDDVDAIETYPASEGFIAYQDSQKEKGLLLNTRSGIFFEFIPLTNFFDPDPPRISLHDVETGVQYALILSSNAGLWAYSIGDTVKFVSKDPHRIVVTGRVSHYISAFGEHVITEEVESALLEVLEEIKVQVTEFSVAPQVNPPEGGRPYHEWFIEFAGPPPGDLAKFSHLLDIKMQEKNIYYRDLLEGHILDPLKIRCVQAGGFRNYMHAIGRLGGQNKAPRLANDRTVADKLKPWLLC